MALRIHLHLRGGRTYDVDFDPAEHPRADNGEFLPKVEANKVIAKAKAAAKKVPKQAVKPAKQPSVPKWTKHDGTEFTPEEHARLKALKVPPAWTHIKLSEDPHAALQVVGRDAKGRTQRKYSAAHSERAAAEKFARLKAFNAVAGKIVTSAQHDMANSKLPQSQRDAAAVIKLIAATGFRIGSEKDTGADQQAYGASTLTKEHIKLRKDGNIDFEFVGKKGVLITKSLQDHELHRYLSQRMRAASSTEKVFDVPQASIRQYLKQHSGAEFKVKDFRTWNGTNEALKAIEKMPVPQGPKELAKARLEVGKIVAKHLGNTPTVALASYIDPAVFGKWERLA